MSKTVKKLYVLIHPGFNTTHIHPTTPTSQQEKDLWVIWKQIALEIENSRDSALIVFPILDRSAINLRLLVEQSIALNDSDWQEFKDRLEEIYGEYVNTKLEVMRKGILEIASIAPTSSIITNPNALGQEVNIQDELKQKGLILDREVKLITFGEYFEYCVERWGFECDRQVRDSKVRTTLTRLNELSLSENEASEIYRELKPVHPSEVEIVNSERESLF